MKGEVKKRRKVPKLAAAAAVEEQNPDAAEAQKRRKAAKRAVTAVTEEEQEHDAQSKKRRDKTNANVNQPGSRWFRSKIVKAGKTSFK